MTPEIVERFLALCQEGPDGCLLFGPPPHDRYQKFYVGRDKEGREVRVYAHRFAHEFLGNVATPPYQRNGKGSGGIVVHHVCEVKSCVRPGHLRVISQRQNVLFGNHPNAILHRRSRCKKGHVMTAANSVVHKSKTHCGKKRVRCRRCQRERTAQ